MKQWPFLMALVAIGAAIFITSSSRLVYPHEAPKGWSYPFNCCSGYDCREVPAQSVSERPEGYTIVATGEVLSYNDERIKNSPDGEFHWCSVKGLPDSKTICLFVPPRGY